MDDTRPLELPLSLLDPARLDGELADCLVADRHRLRRLARSIAEQRRSGRPFDHSLAKLAAQLAASREEVERRRRLRPAIAYDDALPIAAHRAEIAAALADHPVVIVCGETGSGKSTQLPKLCLELGRGLHGLIGHTQPRRIAARSIAARVADELHTPLGKQVGYQVRFADETGPDTLVKLMTDGVLLAETQRDRFLARYDTLIVDEAHERSLNIDFLLGYLKRLLERRDDLRVIITSATIDAARFAAHFGSPDRPAPVIEVSGRGYPVEIRYRPVLDEAGRPTDDDSQSPAALAAAVDELLAEGPGDLLVFLPTERDIRDIAHLLRGRLLGAARAGAIEITPLYARLSAAEQNRVFQPHRGRRIVLATNVAESSLTVPGVRYVIDTGTARLSRYSPRSKVQRLPIEAVSRASADQRAGRCGRVGPGVCIRLFAEDDYLARDRYTTPEIQRTNLAAAILQTLALRLGPIDEFPLLDPPRPEAIRDGYKTLFELGAVDDRRELTELGQRLARLPVDPRVGRMIVAAADEQCLAEVLIIAAALEVQDPRERPAERQQAADEKHAALADERSDFLTYLKLWDFYHRLKEDLSRNRLRDACRTNFLSLVRLREWADVHRQLRQMVDGFGLRVGARRDDPTAVHRALLAGLLSGVAQKSDAREYTGAGGVKFQLWPGSVLAAKKPQWVMGAELVETTRRYLRTAAPIDPAWIEALAPHLTTHTFSEPHWHARSGRVMAWEKVSLFGLPVTPRRRSPFGAIDPAASHDIFVRDGLAAGELQTRGGFLAHNQQLVSEVEQLAARSRRRELVVDRWRIERFYAERVPAEVVDTASFERWRRQVERTELRRLYMTHADLVGGEAGELTPDAFPSTFADDALALPLEYRFEPGAAGDGVTLLVPQAALGRLSAGRLGWLVPGLLEQKVVALIRSLPKPLRTALGPAPDAARRAVAALSFGSGPFLETLAAALSQQARETIRAADFDLARVPEHLALNVRVLDDAGQPLVEGRDLGALREQLGVAADAASGCIDDDAWRRAGLKTWDFGDLPGEIRLPRGGLETPAYPTLVDAGDSVGLRLVDTPERARRELRAGVRRLVVLAERRELKEAVAWLPEINQQRLYAAPLGYRRPLDEQLLDLLAERAYLAAGRPPRTADDFASLLQRGRPRLTVAVQELSKLTPALWRHYHAAQLALDDARAPAWRAAVADMRTQLAELMVEGFLTAAPWPWLQSYPRYLQAIGRRLEKLAAGGQPRDQAALAELAPLAAAYRQRRQEHAARGVVDDALEEYRWMLEEYRVSLFAQELGAAIKISPQRLAKQWHKVRDE